MTDSRKEPAKKLAGARIPVIELFAGAGGLGLAAQAAGGDVRLLVDNDSASCETLRLNRTFHPGRVEPADVAALTGRQLRRLAGLSASERVVITGGPPCQPFSKAAYWTDPGIDSRYRQARARGESAPKPTPLGPRPDERRSLVWEYWRLVSEVRASGFVFENVPSIAHPRNHRLLDELINAAKAEGFKVTFVRSNAVEFGVPQRRERIFVLGAKRRQPRAPEPTHSREPSSSNRLAQAVTTGEALLGIGPPDFDEPEVVVTGRWAEHLREVPPGWNYKHHSAWAGHPSPTFVTETRFWSFLLKLDPDKPSWTIPANPGPWVGPFHWESRRLFTTELAALQGFPAGYRFAGSRRDRVRQIGNAVPPPLARLMVQAVLEAVSGEGSVPPHKVSQ